MELWEKSLAYCFTGIDEVNAEHMDQVTAQGYVRAKRILIQHNAVTEILKSCCLEWEGPDLNGIEKKM